MDGFLIVVLGAVAVMLALILASQFSDGWRNAVGKEKWGVAGGAVAVVAVIALVATLAYAGYSTVRWRAVEAERRSLEAQVQQLAAASEPRPAPPAHREEAAAAREPRLHETAAAPEHRARVYAQPSVNGALIIRGQDLGLAAHYTLVNNGDAPAVGTALVAVVIAHAEADILAVQRALCEGRGAEAVAMPLRANLSPGQSLEMTRIDGGSAATAGEPIPHRGAAGRRFWWVGCVHYRTAGDNARHSSGFLYQIAAASGRPGAGVPISAGDRIVPRDRLVMIPYRHGGFFAD